MRDVVIWALAVMWISAALLAVSVARRKGRRVGRWLVYGLALSPIALIHGLLLSRRRANWGQEWQKCPLCSKRIRIEARTCRHCGQTLPEGWSATWRQESPADPSSGSRDEDSGSPGDRR